MSVTQRGLKPFEVIPIYSTFIGTFNYAPFIYYIKEINRRFGYSGTFAIGYSTGELNRLPMLQEIYADDNIQDDDTDFINNFNRPVSISGLYSSISGNGIFFINKMFFVSAGLHYKYLNVKTESDTFTTYLSSSNIHQVGIEGSISYSLSFSD